MILADFHVRGLPRPKGSPSIMRRRDGRPFMLESKAERSWEAEVRQAAKVKLLRVTNGPLPDPTRDPVALLLDFTFERPRTVKRGSPSVKPDLSKLVRAAEDAMNGLVYHDDAQVVRIAATKSYGEQPGVHVRVLALDAIGAERKGGA